MPRVFRVSRETSEPGVRRTLAFQTGDGPESASYCIYENGVLVDQFALTDSEAEGFYDEHVMYRAIYLGAR